MIKVTFLGDLLCEAPFFRTAKDGATYDFNRAFDGIRSKCAESDFEIGNLETPIAGEHMKYVSDKFTVYSMNAPIQFAEAIKKLWSRYGSYDQ